MSEKLTDLRLSGLSIDTGSGNAAFTSRVCPALGSRLHRLRGRVVLSESLALAALGCAFLLLAVTSRAQTASAELAGWRIGPAAWSFNRFTLFEAVDRTAALGLRYIEAFEGQRISREIDLKLDADLPAETLARLRAKLDSVGIRLTSVYIHTLPGDAKKCRKAFDFCRQLGIETIVSEPEPESLNLIERLCDEYGIKVALHNHPRGSSRYWHPQMVLNACEGRSPRLGACADVGHWQRSGIKPADGVRLLGSRLISMHVKDLNELSPNGHDVPWGTGRGEIGELLRVVHGLRVKPTLFAVEYEYNWDNNSTDIARCVDFFRRAVAEIEAGQPRRELPFQVGWAETDITPSKPVALIGQLHKRISQSVRDPLTATALALETRGEGAGTEQAVLVSCDVLFIQREMQQRLREIIRAKLPGLDPLKVFLNATHTHTGPGFDDGTFKGLYDVDNDVGVMKSSEYAVHFLDRVSQVITEAWQNRKPAGASWALSQAVVGFNRRAHFFDGSSVMYGNTSATNFANVEGYEDHAVRLLYFWGSETNLTGVVVNLSCTAQETENLNEVSADFWHDVREELRRRHGGNLYILPQCAPAGDQSPHLIYRKPAEQIMDQRRSLSRRKEIARRIANAVDDALPGARTCASWRLVFRHTVASADLPEHKPRSDPFYETDSVHPIEFHVLRLGDVVLATNPFELYLDYATRIEARSRAVMTMLVQLCCANSGYLPTARAVKAGGYSADKFIVGPEGGQVLVEETVRRINELWP
jgi:sugar phosphate isomerase/epimerase